MFVDGPEFFLTTKHWGENSDQVLKNIRLVVLEEMW